MEDCLGWISFLMLVITILSNPIDVFYIFHLLNEALQNMSQIIHMSVNAYLERWYQKEVVEDSKVKMRVAEWAVRMQKGLDDWFGYETLVKGCWLVVRLKRLRYVHFWVRRVFRTFTFSREVKRERYVGFPWFFLPNFRVEVGPLELNRNVLVEHKSLLVAPGTITGAFGVGFIIARRWWCNLNRENITRLDGAC